MPAPIGRVVAPRAQRASAVLVAVLLLLVTGAAADASIYWTSGQYGPLGRANLDGSGVEKAYIQTQSLSGVAVSGGRIYWNGVYGIARANLDGSDVDEHFIDGGGGGGMAVNGQHIYWAIAGGTTDGRIGRANLDGSGVDPNFITNVPGPCGLAVDGTYLYWGTVNGGTIGRSKLDGTEVDHEFIGPNDYGKCGVDVDADHVYWANYWSAGTSIGRADLDGTDVDNDFIAGATYPCGVAVDDEHIYWANQFGVGIGRANLDGTGVTQSFVDLTGDNTYRACGVAVDALAGSATTIEATPGSIAYGQPVTLTATVAGTGPTATGSVVFKRNPQDPGTTVPLDGTGRATYTPSDPLDVGDTVTASYRGDATYAPSRSGVAALTIAPATTETRVITTPDPLVSGGMLDVHVTVANLSSDVAPFGRVEFTVDGAALGPALSLDEDGRLAVRVITDVPPGTYTLRADYRDDEVVARAPSFVPSSSTVQVVVVPPPSPASGGQLSPPPLTPAAPPTARTVTRSSLTAAVVVPFVRALKRRGFAALSGPGPTFDAPASGTLTQDVFARVPGRAARSGRRLVRISTARLTFAAPGRKRLTLRLTLAGRRAVKQAKRLRLEIVTRYAPTGGAPVRLVKRLRVNRRGNTAAASRDSRGWWIAGSE